MTWSRRNCGTLNCVTVLIRLILVQLVANTTTALVPWYEEKFSHELKVLSVDEFKFLAEINGTSSPGPSLEEFLDPILKIRLPGSQNHSDVKKFIIDEMIASGWDVKTDAFEDVTPFGVFPFENIIATLNPNVSRRLVLACHYDSKNFTGFEFIGAVDAAVSCSMLLHMASVLKPQFEHHRNNSSQRVTIQFIFFDGEEAFRYWTPDDSIYGSRHLAAKWEATPYPDENTDNTNYLHRMDMLILLDLLGSPSPKFVSLINSTDHWYIEVHNAEVALRGSNYWSGPTTSPLYFPLVFNPLIVEDDHVPFLQRGVQVIHMMPQPLPIVWHTIRDTKDALDFDSIDNLSRVLRIFIAKYIHLSALQ